ncbi:hypothetical protein SAMN05444682_10337 [Parapedobacter indicus]|uniref:Uncharacterized protein n=1 Tax=Parapedobacter indicus TaxID=1477437 RepID=A0A1I3GMH6_9SPHI|nr:hypothetical protein CLV26_10338 [Parapedobacter indicus]SFI24698.1 hypothetical protein SAMN05444682_10337 [Parapedobacter indicus]
MDLYIFGHRQRRIRNRLGDWNKHILAHLTEIKLDPNTRLLSSLNLTCAWFTHSPWCQLFDELFFGYNFKISKPSIGKIPDP